jgi:hypothetical protein
MTESQGSSLLSLLKAPWQARPTQTGISQVLFPLVGPEPRSLGGLGQAFEGRVYPQPGHLEVRQAQFRGVTGQSAPKAGCLLRSGISSRQGSWDPASGMQPWQAARSLLKVICTNSTLAASQNPVCRVPGVGSGDDPSVCTNLSTSAHSRPACSERLPHIGTPTHQDTPPTPRKFNSSRITGRTLWSRPAHP